MKSKKPKLETRGSEILIRIRMQTECRKESVTIAAPNLWKVSVKEQARDNRANDRLLEILRCKYPGRSVRIVKGHHSPSKIVQII